MNEPDRVRLRHMLDAAREVEEFIRGQDRESLNHDQKLVRALTMSIAIIGEAASRISRDFQDINSQIPWPAIISMRNLLIHAYFDINLNVVWDTAVHSIPPLIEALTNLLASDGE